MNINIESILKNATDGIKNATNLKELDDIRVAYFGKKGEITSIMQKFKELTDNERKELGKTINAVKLNIEEQIRNRQKEFNDFILNEKLKREALDVTLPSEKVSKVIFILAL